MKNDDTDLNDNGMIDDPLVEYTLGDKLQRFRIRQKVSAKEIAKHLCINVKSIEALESGDLESLPEQAYCLGFIRGYAAYLNIESDSLVEEFKDFYKVHALKNKKTQRIKDAKYISSPIKSNFNKSTRSNIIIILIITLPIIAGLIILYYSFSVNSDELFDQKTISKVKPLEINPNKAIKSKVQAKKSNKPSKIQKKITTNKIKSTNKGKNISEKTTHAKIIEKKSKPIIKKIYIRSKKFTYIHVKNKNNTPVFEGFLEKRTQMNFPLDQGLKLTSNDIGSLSFTIEDKIKRISPNVKPDTVASIPLSTKAILKYLMP